MSKERQELSIGNFNVISKGKKQEGKVGEFVDDVAKEAKLRKEETARRKKELESEEEKTQEDNLEKAEETIGGDIIASDESGDFGELAEKVESKADLEFQKQQKIKTSATEKPRRVSPKEGLEKKKMAKRKEKEELAKAGQEGEEAGEAGEVAGEEVKPGESVVAEETGELSEVAAEENKEKIKNLLITLEKKREAVENLRGDISKLQREKGRKEEIARKEEKIEGLLSEIEKYENELAVLRGDVVGEIGEAETTKEDIESKLREAQEKAEVLKEIIDEKIRETEPAGGEVYKLTDGQFKDIALFLEPPGEGRWNTALSCLESVIADEYKFLWVNSESYWVQGDKDNKSTRITFSNKDKKRIAAIDIDFDFKEKSISVDVEKMPEETREADGENPDVEIKSKEEIEAVNIKELEDEDLDNEIKEAEKVLEYLKEQLNALESAGAGDDLDNLREKTASDCQRYEDYLVALKNEKIERGKREGTAETEPTTIGGEIERLRVEKIEGLIIGSMLKNAVEIEKLKKEEMALKNERERAQDDNEAKQLDALIEENKEKQIKAVTGETLGSMEEEVVELVGVYLDKKLGKVTREEEREYHERKIEHLNSLSESIDNFLELETARVEKRMEKISSEKREAASGITGWFKRQIYREKTEREKAEMKTETETETSASPQEDKKIITEGEIEAVLDRIKNANDYGELLNAVDEIEGKKLRKENEDFLTRVKDCLKRLEGEEKYDNLENDLTEMREYLNSRGLIRKRFTKESREVFGALLDSIEKIKTTRDIETETEPQWISGGGETMPFETPATSTQEGESDQDEKISIESALNNLSEEDRRVLGGVVGDLMKDNRGAELLKDCGKIRDAGFTETLDKLDKNAGNTKIEELAEMMGIKSEEAEVETGGADDENETKEMSDEDMEKHISAFLKKDELDLGGVNNLDDLENCLNSLYKEIENLEKEQTISDKLIYESGLQEIKFKIEKNHFTWYFGAEKLRGVDSKAIKDTFDEDKKLAERFKSKSLREYYLKILDKVIELYNKSLKTETPEGEGKDPEIESERTGEVSDKKKEEMIENILELVGKDGCDKIQDELGAIARIPRLLKMELLKFLDSEYATKKSDKLNEEIERMKDKMNDEEKENLRNITLEDIQDAVLKKTRPFQ